MIQRNNNAVEPGGQGVVLQGLTSPRVREQRRTVKLLRQYLRSTAVVQDVDFWDPVIRRLQEIALQEDAKDASPAARVLASLRGQDIDILKHLDKNDRLDTGRPTENVRVFVATFDKQG